MSCATRHLYHRSAVNELATTSQQTGYQQSALFRETQDHARLLLYREKEQQEAFTLLISERPFLPASQFRFGRGAAYKVALSACASRITRR